ncbi:GNAT family N-acetyltransferase [Streptacidiphilus sp. ASG 303]|uniref:GNAT family N-acetyltransferase n=1 Tax=Streptacidiphilus sp. ASG 303 TaxID=2896847 RepID=UPI001E2A1513|nr:GNAT family N-acetyltransferase [Streptacidiphilus sp. ASG 303]MCD0480966.1 GNAT family N-acetyltransferase [Streptacidiphilus sp. ASG 303]
MDTPNATAAAVPAPAPAPAAPAPAAPAVGPAAPADIPDLLAFWAQAAEGRSITDDEDGVARLLARDPGALLTARVDGVLAGTVIAGWDGWRCHLYRLAVHPAHRRRGVATALLAAAAERFQTLGGRRADAMVLDRNTAGRAAWQAAGYAPDAGWTRWTRPLPDSPEG